MRQFVLLALALLEQSAFGQFTTVINSPPDPAPDEIDSDTQLNLFEGSVLSRRTRIGASDGSSTNIELNIFSGVFAAEIAVNPNSTVNMRGGALRWIRVDDSVVTIFDGSIASVGALGSTAIEFRDGLIGSFSMGGDSSLDVSGGRVDGSVYLGDKSSAKFSGGSVAGDIFGSRESSLEIVGGEFLIDGESIAGLSQPGDAKSIDMTGATVLSGTLADGSPFSLTPQRADWSDLFVEGALSLYVADLPVAGPPVIEVPRDSAPFGIRAGQTVIVEGPEELPKIPPEQRIPFFDSPGQSGSTDWTLPRSFQAGPESTVQVNSGFVASDVRAVSASIDIAGGFVAQGMRLFAGSELDMSGGSVVGFLADRSVARIEGGRVTASITLRRGSSMMVRGGDLEGIAVGDDSTLRLLGGTAKRIDSHENGVADVLPGAMAEKIVLRDASMVRVSGGRVNEALVQSDAQLVVSGGTFGAVGAEEGGRVTVLGGEFRLNGEPLLELEMVGESSVVDLEEAAVLSGILADGRPFAFARDDRDRFDDGTLELVSVHLPARGADIVHVPSDVTPVGLRSGQMLHLGDGGLIGDNFRADWGSSVKMTGGEIGSGFEAVGADISISGGNVDHGLKAFRGTTIAVSDGIVANLTLFDGSSAQLSQNGELSSVSLHQGGALSASDRSAIRYLHMTGGETVVVDETTLGNVNVIGGKMRIDGGDLAGDFGIRDNADVEVWGGSMADSLRVKDGGKLNFFGSDFRLNGEPLSRLEQLGDSRNVDINNWKSYAVLSGVLADGTPLVLAPWDGGVVLTPISVTLVDVPHAQPAMYEISGESALRGLREGQSLTLHEGGSVRDNFTAGSGSSLAINGGRVGSNLEVIDGTVDISGGTIGSGLGAFQNAVVNILDGHVESARAFDGSIVNVSGGTINHLRAYRGSVVNISGGAHTRDFTMYSGSQWNITGGEFYLDGAPIQVPDGTQASVRVPKDSVLSGVLADGTPIVLSPKFVPPAGDYYSFALRETALPPIESEVLHALSDEIPIGIRSGQTLIVESGAEVGDRLRAVRGSTVRVEGGRIGENFSAVGANVLVSAGEIGNKFWASGGSTVEITGGAVGGLSVSHGSVAKVVGGATIGGVSASYESTVNLADAHVENSVSASNGSNANLTDVSVGFNVIVGKDSVTNLDNTYITGSVIVARGGTLNFHGGSIGDDLQVDAGGEINLYGTQFILGREDITESLLIGSPFVISDRGSSLRLRGLLADGSEFQFELDDRDSSFGDRFDRTASLTIIRVAAIPEPSTLVLLALAYPILIRARSYSR